MNQIVATIEGKAGRISLNRPEALHALTQDMCSEMIAALAEWRRDDAVEAVMLDHAEGRGFCAGGDVRMLAESGVGDGKAARAFFHEEYRLNHYLFGYAKKTVAFMDGITMGGGVGISLPCTYRIATENTRFAMPETAIGLFPDVGGGCEVAMMADIIIAADNAQFGQPEIKLGVTPGMGGSQRLIRAVGKSKAMEMCLTGRMMSAEEAERSGLVARVVPAADLQDEALKTAEAIASMAPLAALAVKEMVNAAEEMSLAQGIRFERRLFHGLFGTEDQKEGMAAFVGKRKAEWKGR